jgi:hypothetical protein
MEKTHDSTTPVHSNQSFGEYIDFIIRDKLESDGQIIRLLDLYNVGFAASKKGDLVDAGIQFELTNSLAENVTAESLHWVTALSGGNLSYYFYKAGDYDAANTQTLKNIEASQYIMQKYACWGLFWGEIQQLHNLGRIQLKQNNVDAFLEKCSATFPKMYLAFAEWRGTRIKDDWEWQSFTAIGYDMLIQVFSETMHSILFAKKGNEKEIKKDLSGFLQVLLPAKYADITGLPEKFKLLDDFILLVYKILEHGTDALNEEDLKFVTDTKENKELSKVLYNLVVSIP